MADKNYYPQTQGDTSQAEAQNHVRIFGFELLAGEVSEYFYPGNAKNIMWISSSGASKTDGVVGHMRQAAAAADHEGDGIGSGTEVTNVATFLEDAPNTVAYGSTSIGFIAGTHVPHEMALKNLHGSTTAKVTMYINY